MLSSARKLALRHAAVVLQLLVSLGLFGAGTQVVAHAADAHVQTQNFVASNAASLDHLQADAPPADMLAEPEQPEQDAALAVIAFRFTTHAALVVRFGQQTPCLACASRWQASPIRSAATAQGPP